MAARHAAICIETQPDQHVAAESLHKCNALANAFGIYHAPELFRRHLSDDLFDQGQALFDLADTNPYARIDVAGIEDWHFEGEFIVRRVTQRAPRVKATSRSAPNVAAGAELARVVRPHNAGRDGTVL